MADHEGEAVYMVGLNFCGFLSQPPKMSISRMDRNKEYEFRREYFL